jgi:AcrR family transcriptional regulator
MPPKAMPRTTSVKQPAARRWSTTEAVRADLLDAARAVFVKRGFAEASVTEVVERAGSSVGSLYHHFGSKTDLFLALWERHYEEQRQIARAAVAVARQEGVTDPYDLFLAGARAYLEATWSRRDLVRIFQLGDTPPGFQEVQRRGGRAWLGAHFKLLGAENDAVHRVLVWLVTSFIGEARREIVKSRSARAAATHVTAMVEVLERMRPIITGDLGVELSYEDDDE